MVASHKVVQMVTHHRLGCQCVLDASTVVVEPDILGRFTFLEEKNIGFDTLSIEDTSRETENGMQVEVLQEFLADGLASTALKEYVIRQYHSGTTAIFEHDHHVLKEVQLIVLCCNN